jgi:replicative DNA helicase
MSLREIGESLNDDIYHGTPPVEYAVSTDPWGSMAFRPGEIMCVAAPPGMGKTAFIMQTTLDALRLNPDVRCMIVNVEMSRRNLYERQLSRLSGVPLADITRRRDMLGRQYQLNRAIATMHSVGDRMFFMPGPFHINRISDAMVRDVRPDILVIDYLQRIECCEGVADTRSRVNLLMNKFRTIAEAGVCVVLVSAVGRPSAKRKGGYNSKELGLASLRESGEIEYGCDDVYLMGAENEDAPRKGDGRRNVVLKHEKSRNHSQQDLRFEFDGAIQRFSLLPTLDDLYEQGEDDGDGPQTARATVVTPQPPVPPTLLLPGDRFAADCLQDGNE